MVKIVDNLVALLPKNWGVAKRLLMMCLNTLPPSDIRELEKYVKGAGMTFLWKLINSIPRRIKAVIAANGNRIKY